MISVSNEIICGFQVLPFPEKPGYLSISDEEFRQKTLAAWSRGGCREKITAALRGGEHEWAVLYNDSDTSFRAAVACRANEAIQMKMITDPEPVVRKLLARYSTDKVRTAAIVDGAQFNHGTVAGDGNVRNRHQLIPLVTRAAEFLQAIMVKGEGAKPVLDFYHPALGGQAEPGTRQIIGFFRIVVSVGVLGVGVPGRFCTYFAVSISQEDMAFPGGLAGETE